MISSDLGDAEVLDQYDVTGPNGERYRVLNMRHRSPSNPLARNTFMIPQHRRLPGEKWQTLPLAVVWFHWPQKRASAWPPEEALGAFWRDNMFSIEYESPWDPWAKAHTHALWQASFDTRRRKWLLKRLRLYAEDERARR